MQLLKYAKIALLIVILAEEIKSARKPKYTVNMQVDNQHLKDVIENYISNRISNFEIFRGQPYQH